MNKLLKKIENRENVWFSKLLADIPFDGKILFNFFPYSQDNSPFLSQSDLEIFKRPNRRNKLGEYS